MTLSQYLTRQCDITTVHDNRLVSVHIKVNIYCFEFCYLSEYNFITNLHTLKYVKLFKAIILFETLKNSTNC
jgi:hypothetical protein